MPNHRIHRFGTFPARFFTFSARRYSQPWKYARSSGVVAIARRAEHFILGLDEEPLAPAEVVREVAADLQEPGGGIHKPELRLSFTTTMRSHGRPTSTDLAL
jgi:hypothetical protein